MKKTIQILLLAGLFASLFACQKPRDINPAASGTINVTNAVIGGSTITLMTNPSLISSSNTVGSNAGAFFPLATGNIQINLGVPPVPATPNSPAVAAINYYSQPLSVDNHSNYSLFLTGTSPAAVENVLIKDAYPNAYADSVCGVRFINLAPGSNPISVNIKGNPNGSEVASLTYKGNSNFAQHPAKKTNTTYIFEFRDATTGSLITTYTLATPFFHNVTLCLRGIIGGSNGIIRTNDY